MKVFEYALAMKVRISRGSDGSAEWSYGTERGERSSQTYLKFSRISSYTHYKELKDVLYTGSRGKIRI